MRTSRRLLGPVTLRATAWFVLFVIVAVGLLYAGVQVWARANLESSTTARAIAWGESDVDDITRFPQRTIQAPDHPRPLSTCRHQLSPDRYQVRAESQDLQSLLEETRTRGFLVIAHGCVATEAYDRGAGPSTLLTSFSVAKSVLATVVGAAIDEGYLPSLDVPVADYVPDLASRDPRYRAITL